MDKQHKCSGQMDSEAMKLSCLKVPCSLVNGCKWTASKEVSHGGPQLLTRAHAGQSNSLAPKNLDLSGRDAVRCDLVAQFPNREEQI